MKRSALLVAVLVYCLGVCLAVTDGFSRDEDKGDRDVGHACSNGVRISPEKLCDGVDDCQDGFASDECECGSSSPPSTCERWGIYKAIFPNKNASVAVGDKETRLKECILRGDLVNCSLTDSIPCDDGLHCIAKDSFCDGTACCPDGSDERRLGFGLKCATTGSIGSGACVLPGSHNKNATHQCTFGLENCYLSGSGLVVEPEKGCFQCLNREHAILPEQVCDGVLDCADFSDECLCEDLRIEESICAALYDASVSSEDSCVIDQGGLPCGDGGCVAEDLWCDGERDCENGLDEQFCITGQGGIGHILCNRTDITRNTIYIVNATLCDGVLECDDRSDECSKRCSSDGKVAHPACENGETLNEEECEILDDSSFSSAEDMLSSAPLRWILWIGGIIAFTGNVGVLIMTTYIFLRKKELLHTIAKCHHTLVLHLSIADFLMSIYLLATAIQGTRFSGQYCSEDVSWRSSTFCAVLGTLVIVSSEMSVLVMLIMSAFRFASVYRPLQTYASPWSVRLVRFFIALAWAISILIGVIPLLEPLQLYFTSEAWVECDVFSSDFVSVDSMKHLATRVQAFVKRNRGMNASAMPGHIETLSDIEAYYSELCPQAGQPRWFGFYGRNSVCLPQLFAHTSLAAWEYSISVIMLNFLAFCGMLTVYCLIVWVSFKSHQQLKNQSGKNEKKCDVPKCKLQARVTRLLVTDFLCWIPICVVSAVYLAGVPVAPTVFAVCGIVLLPLNSALNPVLYSGICDTIYKKFCRSRDKGDSRESTELARQSTKIVGMASRTPETPRAGTRLHAP